MPVATLRPDPCAQMPDECPNADQSPHPAGSREWATASAGECYASHLLSPLSSLFTLLSLSSLLSLLSLLSPLSHLSSGRDCGCTAAFHCGNAPLSRRSWLTVSCFRRCSLEADPTKALIPTAGVDPLTFAINRSVFHVPPALLCPCLAACCSLLPCLLLACCLLCCVSALASACLPAALACRAACPLLCPRAAAHTPPPPFQPQHCSRHPGRHLWCGSSTALPSPFSRRFSRT